MKRWLLAALAAGALAAVFIGTGQDGGTPVEELRRRVARLPESSAYSFTYAAAGTEVLDCVLPNRSFSVSVDRAAGKTAIRTSDGHGLLAVVAPGSALLHRRLFAPDAIPTEWVAAELPVAPPRDDALRRALGVDLARYVLEEPTPASAREIAEAALSAAEDVTRPSENSFRVTLSNDAATASTEAPGAATPRPVIDLEFSTSGSIAVIEVTTAARPAPGEEPSEGWTLHFDGDQRPAGDEPEPVVADVTPIEQLDPASVRGPRADCRLPT